MGRQWQTLRHTGKTFAAKDRLPGDSPLRRHRDTRVSSDTAMRRGVSRVNTDTFRHGGCSPHRFSLLPPDRARPFHHRLAASRTGISRPICLNVFPGREPVRFSFCLPPARSPSRADFSRFPGTGRFSGKRPIPSFSARTTTTHLWRQKTDLRFFIPSMKRHAP